MSRRRQLLVLALFALSGAAGLVYQVVWTRELTLVFGVSSLSVSTVLAVFMAGLALGSWWFGRLADRLRSPLALYGLLELGVAAAGWASLPLIHRLPGLLVTVHRADPALTPWLRPLLAAAILLLPTVLMGGTLPALVKAVGSSVARAGRDAGLLYAVNTLGAAAGTLAAAFWLIQRLGLEGSTLAAVGANLACGLGALLLARTTTGRPAVTTPARPAPTGAQPVRAVLVAIGLSGFLALAYEVLWTRYLIYVIGENSVHAFALMLATFLVGLTVGSAAAGPLADRSRNPAALLGAVMVLIGAAAITTASLIGALVLPAAAAESTTFWTATGWHVVKCLGILLVPTALSGATFTLAVRAASSRDDRRGRDLGRVYAANTVGAIAGAAAGGFLVLPALGLRRGLLALASVHVLAGFGLLLASRRCSPVTRSAWVGGAAVGLALLGLHLAPDPRQGLMKPGYSLAFYADGPESSVAVLRSDRTGHLGLIVEGDGQAHTSAPGQLHLRQLGHLPLLFHPDPRDVLVVGLGAGITAGSVTRHPVERVDVVELSPAVIAAASLFAPFNHDPLADPRVHLHRGDGRHHLLTADRTYDVVTSDPVDPDDAGATSLHSLEYYRLVRSRLGPGGMACQWLDTNIGFDEYRMLVRTFVAVFPHTSIWNGGGFTVLVGSSEPPRVSLADLRRRFSDPGQRESLAVVGLDSPEALLSCLLAGPDRVRAFVGEGPLNTDDRPLIEYLGPRRSRVGREQDRLWMALLALRSPDLGDWVAGWSPADASACAPAYRAAGSVLEWARLRASLSAPGPADRELWPAWAERRRAEGNRYLALTWELLLPSTPGVARVLAGAPTPDLMPALDHGRRAGVEGHLEEGARAWAAGDLVTARERFVAASTAAPRAPRPALLAVAATLRGGDMEGGLRALLEVPADEPWVAGLVRDCAPLVLEEAIWGLRASPGSVVAARSRALYELTPSGPPPWGGDSLRPPRSAATDAEAWLIWFLRQGRALEARDGALQWPLPEG